MKKNVYSLVVLSSIFILIINIFIKSQHLTSIIIFSVNLFIKNIFPSIFPMFVLSSILVEIGLPKFLGSLFNNTFKTIFRVSGYASFVFFMSMITGFPSSAKYINDLIDEGIIDEEEAKKILCFTFFSNPLFITNTIGIVFLNNIKIGFVILIAHFLGNIITGLIFRNFNNNINISKMVYNFSINDFMYKISNTNIFKAVLDGIKLSLEILVNIFGIITFFLIVLNTLFRTPSNYLEIFITGVVEMTTGLKFLSISNVSFDVKALTSTFFISFGGFSVHAQIMNILKEKKVKYLPFLTARIVHALVSTIIVYLYLLLNI